MALGFLELIVLLVLPAIVAVVVFGWFGAPTRDRYLQEWAAAHGLGLTSGNVGFVRHYLTTGRRLRLVCVVGGLVLPPLARVAFVPSAHTGVTFSLIGVLVGYALGTLWAELALTRPGAGGPRAASLTPRRVEDYLSPVLRFAPRLIAAAVAAAWIVVIFTRADPVPGQHTDLVSDTAMRLSSGFAMLTAVGIELVQKWILRRPQPIVAPDLLAADDAIRSSSLHLLAGTGSAILLCWLIAPLLVVAAQTDDPATAIFRLLGVASFLAALFFWRFFGNRAWRVRRPAAAAPVQALGASR